ncbi:thiamine-binding protein [Trichloromonas sp.]|uniref:thiamine-binding protein n=1 Tax=Trichloromonas sp. TaxID=3069249 RepID=UPI002A3FE510|nr:thiamine-binding protein [Trichloromonas sp.]
MAVVEVSVTPLGTYGAGVSSFVAGCLRLVEQSGLHYQLMQSRKKLTRLEA